MYVKARILKGDGTDCGDEDIVSPVNLWIASLFSQVNVYLQQKLISTATTNYPYKAYLEVLLNYGIGKYPHPQFKKNNLTFLK